MRRLISISLLLLLSLSLVSPLFAMSSTDASIPACCRRSGKHHCIMADALAQHSTRKANAATLQGICPYNLAARTAINLPFVPDEIRAAISSSTVCTPANLIHAEAPICTSFNRSHQKRGPPSLLFSQS